MTFCQSHISQGTDFYEKISKLAIDACNVILYNFPSISSEGDEMNKVLQESLFRFSLNKLLSKFKCAAILGKINLYIFLSMDSGADFLPVYSIPIPIKSFCNRGYQEQNLKKLW